MLRRGVSDVQALGNVACANVEACYNEVFDAVSDCAAADDGFIEGVIDRATEMYKARAEQALAEFGEQNDNTIAGRLVNIAMKRFTDIDSLRAFVSQRVGDDVIDDAMAGYQAAKEAAAAFCDSGCVDQTGKFLKRLFSSMNKGRCVDATMFCVKFASLLLDKPKT